MTPQEYMECYEKTDEESLKKVQEYNKELIKKYPFLKPYNVYTGKEISDYNYSSTWLDDMPRGWRIAFAEDLCKELLPVLEKGNYVDKYMIAQVKEKFGGLRWYDCGTPEEIHDEVQDLISKYEDLSFNTCCLCGKKAAYESTGWICPYCESCANEIYRNHHSEKSAFKDFFIKKEELQM